MQNNLIHQCTICTKKEFEEFKNGSLKYNIYSEKLVPYYIPSFDENKELVNMNYKEYKKFLEDHNYEFYYCEKENIVSFGLFGLDL